MQLQRTKILNLASAHSDKSPVMFWNRNPGIVANKLTGELPATHLKMPSMLNADWSYTLYETIKDLLVEMEKLNHEIHDSDTFEFYVSPDVRVILEDLPMYKSLDETVDVSSVEEYSISGKIGENTFGVNVYHPTGLIFVALSSNPAINGILHVKGFFDRS